MGAAIVAALIITVIDVYVTGHGYSSIMREIITWRPAGVHLSIGDVGMLAAVVVVAVSTWYLVGRRA
jgi:hypothetical protein